MGKIKIPIEIRWLVWERDNFTCQNCGNRKYLEVDHIIPESKGGKTEENNLQTLCKQCNREKRNKIPLKIKPDIGIPKIISLQTPIPKGKSKGGIAVVEKYGPGYMADIGRRGGLFAGHGKGRPPAITINNIIESSMASERESDIKNKNNKEGSPALISRDTLLELWNRRRDMVRPTYPASSSN